MGNNWAGIVHGVECKKPHMGNFKCMGWVYFTNVPWLSEARKVTLGAWYAANGELQNASPAQERGRCRASSITRASKGCFTVPGRAALPRTAPGTAACVKLPRTSTSVWDMFPLRARHTERYRKLEFKVLLKVSAILSETTFFSPLESSWNYLPPATLYVVTSSFALTAVYFSNILILHGCLVYNLYVNGLKLPS